MTTLPGAPASPTPAAPPPLVSRRLITWAAAFLLMVGLIAGVVWWFTPPPLHGVVIQSPRAADDFTLIASTGEPVSLSDLRGKVVLLFFGYTYCPDICPTTLNDLALMAEELGARRMREVQVVFVSVDPERDTPEQLATYLRYFHPSFLGMTGDLADLQRIATQFGIFFEKHADTGLVDHSSAITVLDRKGFVRLVIPHGTSGKEMAADIAYLLRRG